MANTITNRLILVLILLVFSSALTGCTGIFKGITEAVLESSKQKEDTRSCYIRGRPIAGIKSALYAQELAGQQNNATTRVIKVLMVHGIGSHRPGYSTRMAENLARSLDLTLVQEPNNEFRISYPAFTDHELGVLRISRFFNADKSKEMIFAELTWDTIIEPEKQNIAFDNSGEYSFRRTPINNALKTFVNDTIPDVMMYNGKYRKLIQMSVSQALCWLMAPSSASLPNGGVHYCNNSAPDYKAQFDDDYFFITHSIGSRVTVDSLQLIAELATTAAKNDPVLEEKLRRLREKKFTVFMLSNQLPLLQLGQPTPVVHGRIEELCGADATRPEDRLFKETHLVAFSDPNDILSYAIPPRFLDEQVDSRICPTLTNVVLNVAEVKNILGGDFANPLTAHTEYDNDERVIGIISRGIGNNQMDPSVARRCTWLETVATDRNGLNEGERLPGKSK